MIHHLDDTIKELLLQNAEDGSLLKGADISFDLPDAQWRAGLEKLTVNCYLYDVRENRDLRTNEPLIQRNHVPLQPNSNTSKAARVRPPVRIDCAYCITAWSPADDVSVAEEHQLLSEVLVVLLQNPTITDQEILQGTLKEQIPPYPTVIAAPDGVKNQPEFWSALNQLLKPSLNYVVTLAYMLDEAPDWKQVVTEVKVKENEDLKDILDKDC